MHATESSEGVEVESDFGENTQTKAIANSFDDHASDRDDNIGNSGTQETTSVSGNVDANIDIYDKDGELHNNANSKKVILHFLKKIKI